MKDTSGDPRPTGELAAQAARHLIELESEQADNEVRSACVDFLLRSPEHVNEMLHAQHLRTELGSFSRWSEVTPLEDDESTVVPFARGVTMSDDSPTPARRARRRRVLLAAAGSAAAVLLAGFFGLVLTRGPVLRTQLGESREVTLADGSVVTLAPASELSVEMSDRERRVVLSRGDAFFHVAKNPRRPFVVYTKAARIRAVGTAFGVQTDANRVVVSVVEGRVAVSGDRSLERVRGRATPPPAAVSVAADEQVTVEASGDPGVVRKINGATELAWASGQLIFEDEEVATVVSRFNRYNRTQIVIQWPELARRRVSGVFKADEPTSFVSLITSMTGVSAVHEGDRLIVIGPAAVRRPDSTVPN